MGAADAVQQRDSAPSGLEPARFHDPASLAGSRAGVGPSLHAVLGARYDSRALAVILAGPVDNVAPGKPCFFSNSFFVLAYASCQYAANVYFGLLKDESGALFVEVLHDRVPVSVAGLPTPAPFADFVSYMQSAIVPDRQQACHAGASAKRRGRASKVDPEVAYLCGN